MRMAFLHASPTSTINPICVKMLMSIRAIWTPTTEQSRHIGTTRITARGSDQLPEGGIALDVDLPGPPEAVEVVHVQRTEVDLERVEDLVHRHAHGAHLVAVDVQEEPGGVGPEAGEEPLEALGAVALGDDLLGG